MSLGHCPVLGILYITPEGYGFLRDEPFVASTDDVYVPMSVIRRYGLQPGDMLMGIARPPREHETYHSLLRVETINGRKVSRE